MMQQETGKRKFFIQLHSIVDVITNSSSELYIFDTGKAEQALKEAIQVLAGKGLFGIEPVNQKEWIIPEGMDPSNIFMINLEHGEQSDNIYEDLCKHFTEIELKYNDDY